MPDPYEIIGVRRDASLDEIRIAYRRSAQVLHPDRFATSSDGVRSEAARRMLQLNSAMEAIESERADEASGTGNLGSVSFAQRSQSTAPAPGPTQTTPAPRPLPASDPQPPTSPNGAPTPTVGAPSARVDLPETTAARPTAPGSEVTAPPPKPVVASRPSAPAYAVPERQAAVAPPEPAAPAPEPRPIVPETRLAPDPYALGADNAFATDYDDDYDDVPAVSRRSRGGSGARGRLPMVIVGIVILAAIAVIAGYFLYGRTTGSGEQTFAKAGAPFTFRYPKDFHQRRLDGGVALNKPTYQIGFGLDSSNYLLASTYKLGFTVQADGSATGPKGQQLTPDQINHDIDVTIAKLAGQAGFKQQGVESGSLGPLRARIYDYAKPDGSLSSTFVVALQGKTEYYVTCQSSPRGEKVIAKACARLLATFARA
jgi:hypothetical protein